MNYCKKCRKLCTEVACPSCGSKKLSVPEVNDPVYLTNNDFFESGIIEGALEENHIPYEMVGTLGRGITPIAGTGLESYTFYVPYGAYDKCQEILTVIFGE